MSSQPAGPAGHTTSPDGAGRHGAGPVPEQASAPSTADDLTFPTGFAWGAATASYQIEGAVDADGRGRSVWDTFSHTPGNVRNGDTGDVACDHYHRYADDVALMADLNLGTYRFSVAWPRVQPHGSGPANPAGLDFYERLVDALLARGIDPMVTLFHWDLPQTLEDLGGWPARDTAFRFAEFATLVYDRIGDRVGSWVTLNEPWCAAFLGYGSGIHAPGRHDPAAAFAACHHMLLGHGEAVRALRERGASQVGITLNPVAVRPADPSSEDDQAAVRLIDGLQNRLFLDPVYGRGYPADVLAVARRFGPLEWLRTGDERAIGEPVDLLGVNYYSPTVVKWQPGTPASGPFPGSENVAQVKPPGPRTAMDWVVEPSSFTDLLERLATDYPGAPIWVTENGAAFSDAPDASGTRVPDQRRTAYLDGHLRAVHTAIARGVDVRGYLAWSLMDNFEWSEGYARRFGLYYVDYETQQRIAKDSAYWYRDVIARNGLRGPALPQEGEPGTES